MFYWNFQVLLVSACAQWLSTTPSVKMIEMFREQKKMRAMIMWRGSSAGAGSPDHRLRFLLLLLPIDEDLAGGRGLPVSEPVGGWVGGRHQSSAQRDLVNLGDAVVRRRAYLETFSV